MITLTPRAAERFWPKVDRGDDSVCWPWLASVIGGPRGGYGQFRTGGSGSRMRKAHVIAYEQLVGPVPDGLVLDHLCRNRACCNPAHLEPVTIRENLLRSPLTPASRTHCPAGHPYDEQNTYHGNGRRSCRACKRKAA